MFQKAAAVLRRPARENAALTGNISLPALDYTADFT